MARVGLKNVNKSFGPTQVIHDVTSLSLEDRRVRRFCGSVAGSGESTLLRMIAGLEEVFERRD